LKKYQYAWDYVRTFAAAVVSRVRVRLRREGWNGYSGPQGTSSPVFMVVTLEFRDQNDYAEGLVAESVNDITCEMVSANEEG
jgi:hypothetical protein